MNKQLLNFSKLTLPIMLIGIILMGSGCEEDDKKPELPPITQSGENTFGCLVDGEVWLPKKGMITTPPFSVSNYQYDDGRWLIIANNLKQSIYFYMCQDSLLKGSTTFLIESLDNCSTASFYDESEESRESKKYRTDGDAFNGQLIITRFDLEELIIAGTFYFDAINDNGNVVKIREGRFDLKFPNYNPFIE
ncbi:DUF6252 family protein [Carboxylicivirga sp. M1479]|uniref:DUF6252 family protein n=1 Tax=Carboxylicivirga sp. M1479 TaxID=2594476 RepID=UPI001177F3DD|nr:DUF6252 family protein [Carboxylicivirga sp. M1479]TRX72186.1 hypothetical protein FNN09_02095 [Carboxylicivirga sp. M1479]